jgi:phosphatidate cytidylyltransferase
MKTRIIAGLIGLPIALGLIFFGGLYLLVALLIISLIGMKEIYKALLSTNKNAPQNEHKIKSRKRANTHYIGYFYTVIYYLLLPSITSVSVLILLAMFMLTILIHIVIFNEESNIFNAMVTFFGFIYVAVMLSFIYLVRDIEFLGVYLVWLVLISSWGCDTMAYFTGVFFGKNKLAPKLSPKKTIEGSLGGVLGAMLITALYLYLLLTTFGLTANKIIIAGVLITFVGAIFSQFGDLSASSIKRYANVKDYSTLIPGHGGILDRFDSVIFTAPVVYVLILIFM